MSFFQRVLRVLAGMNKPARASFGPVMVDLGVFADLFKQVEFKILDVGARGGPLEWLTFLAPFSIYYGCEPDAGARAPLKRSIESAHPWKDVIIAAEAIAEPEGLVKLNHTRHPGMSSLLQPNMAVVRDFGLESEFTVLRQVEIPAITLANAARRYGFEELALIKVDTQGSELNILESGRDLLTGPVQGVFVEVEFRRFYCDQPLFSEVEMFLRNCGFELISLESVTRRRTTTGLSLGFSRREIAWAHALFIKHAPKMEDHGESEFFRRSVHQIGIAMASEQFDLAADRLMNRHFQHQLSQRGLSMGLDTLDSYIRGTVSRSLYCDFVENLPAVVKHRDQLRSR